MSVELRISFPTSFYTLLSNYFLLSKGCSSFVLKESLIISYKHQHLLLSLGDCLEEKNRQISWA